MELLNKHVTDFLAVADAGSFSRAARELGVSQPALSQSVRALERETGLTLFERGREGASLTDAGRKLLHAAEQARSLLEDASKPRKKLVVGVNARRCGVVTGAVGGVFRQAHPDIDLCIHDIAGNNTVESGLAEGCDLVEAPSPDDGDVRIAETETFAPCTFQRLVLCVPPDHPLATCGHPCTFDDLRGETICLFKRGVLACNDRFMDELELRGITANLVLVDDGSYNDLDMLVNGWLSPALKSLASRHAPLVPVPFEPASGMLVGFTYRGEPTPAARLFIDFARAHFGEYR
jgi:DNA-binding transcriptional LysR family regulator